LNKELQRSGYNLAQSVDSDMSAVARRAKGAAIEGLGIKREGLMRSEGPTITRTREHLYVCYNRSFRPLYLGYLITQPYTCFADSGLG